LRTRDRHKEVPSGGGQLTTDSLGDEASQGTVRDEYGGMQALPKCNRENRKPNPKENKKEGAGYEKVGEALGRVGCRSAEIGTTTALRDGEKCRRSWRASP